MMQRSAANLSSPSLCVAPVSCGNMLRLRGGGAVDEFNKLKSVVETFGACALPGCTIKYNSFMTVLRRAQSRGYVKDHEADYVADGLQNGFTLGADLGVLRRNGRRVFKNYKSAYDNYDSVTAAIKARLAKGKTVILGGDATKAVAELCAEFLGLAVFPLGAVLKPNQDETLPLHLLVWRPTSDHTKTGFNAATVLGILGHSLDTYNEVAWFLKKDFFMRVSDVEDAFMLIPLHPAIWPYMLFRWSTDGAGKQEQLLMHTFADFGTRGMPGTFQLFLVRVVVQMARSEMVLTLPMTVFVDDAAVIGPMSEAVDTEMTSFQDWSTRVCGVPWKVAKDRVAASPQYYIGFWWDSHNLTRSLSEVKLTKYLSVILEASLSRSLTLQFRQSLAGKVQRAILTLPPGAACLLVNCYRMMSGLTLPWHTRRTSRAEREDYRFVHGCLTYVEGKGYYSYDGHPEGPTCLSDASKSRQVTDGGYVDSWGFYDFFHFGSRASRKLIDELEGETVAVACRTRGAAWQGHRVPFGIDNQAFERSAERGRSAAERLNRLLKELFVLQIQHGFILQPFWISTDDNYLADHLSRGREAEFLAALPASEFLVVPFSELKRHRDAGRVHTFGDADRGMAALRQLLDGYSSNTLKDGPSRGAGVGGDAQLLSISYPTTSIYEGLPPDLEDALDEVMDNRLAVSSRGKVMTAVNRWTAFCATRDWSPIIEFGDSARGSKLAAWVMQMKDDTTLVYRSIAAYVWGVRTWQVLQHQPDPCYGVMHWREFMRGIAVLTAVPGEPRRMFPLDTFTAIMQDLDPSCFEDAQFGLVLLVLLFTFSRTECPCPKSWSGRETFDSDKHWTVADFKLQRTNDGKWVLWVRFKAIKQDPRKERPSIGGPLELPFEDDDASDGAGRDWVPVGDVPELPDFSIARWYMAFVRALGRERGATESMFLARDKVRPYTYGCLRADLHSRLEKLGLDTSLTPHCVRVLGYNLSKRGNGVDLTVAHGGWLSAAHDRYERFSNLQMFGIPAGMLQVANPFEASAHGRAISRDRAQRYSDAAYDGADGGDVEADSASASVESHAQLPSSFTERVHVAPSGRTYRTYVGPGGQVARSRVEAWRLFSASRASPTRDAADDEQCQSASSGDGYEPFTLFDVSSPVARQASPTVRRERLSDMARRIRSQGAAPGSAPARHLPFGASFVAVEVDDDQCGNPQCLVKSKNGLHAGPHRFPEPPPRR